MANFKGNSKDAASRVYLDYASAMPADPRVVKAMEPYWTADFANPRSVHREGEQARQAFETARQEIARLLHAREREIVFTGGATESNTLAIRGTIDAYIREHRSLEGFHFITSAIEHPSILSGVPLVERAGGTASVVSVPIDGVVDALAIRQMLRPETRLVSLAWVNSEIGTTASIGRIVRMVREYEEEEGLQHRICIHLDATQAPLYLPVNTERLGVDLLTLDAGKMHGPKGIGCLYVRQGAPLASLMLGKREEESITTGTPPVPLIVGFAEALRIALEEREAAGDKVGKLRDYFIALIEKHFPDARINGSRTERVANNVSVTFPGEDHEFLAVRLDERGVAVATRSACLEGGGEGSHVVAALAPANETRDALRFTLGKATTKKEINSAIRALNEVLR